MQGQALISDPLEKEGVLRNKASPQTQADSLRLSSLVEKGYVRRLLSWPFLVSIGLAIGLAAAVEPAVALLLVLGLLILPGATRNAHLVILAIAVYTPFEEFILKWMPGSLGTVLRFGPEALIALLLAALLLGNLGQGRLWKKTPIDLPVGLFVAFSALSAMANDVPVLVWIFGIREFARYILLYYLVVNAGLTDRFMKLLVVSLLVAATVEAGVGLVQAGLGNRFSSLLVPEDVVVGGVMVRSGFTQILSGHTRIFGTLGRYNTFGFFLAMFGVLIWGLYVALRARVGMLGRVGFIAFAALAGPAILLSFARTSWVALYAGTIVVLIAARWKRMLVLATAIPVVATVLVVSWVSVQDWRVAETEEASLAGRLASTFSPGYIDVLLRHGRLFSLLRVSPIVLQEYPWLGLGPGTIGSLATGGGTNSPGMFPEHSHEDWIDVSDVGEARSLKFLHDVGWVAILAQVGVLGLLAYVWVIVELVRVTVCCIRGTDDRFVLGLSWGYLAWVAVVVLGNFSIFLLTLRAISMYFWLFGGLITTLCLRLHGGALPAKGRAREVS